MCLGLSGCGGDWGAASGTVLLDDKSLEKGMITFNPKADGAPGYGQVIDGNFTIRTGDKEGLKSGEYTVTIYHMTVPAEESGESAQFLTPKKYASVATSDLRAEVKPGANTFTFKMKSGD